MREANSFTYANNFLCFLCIINHNNENGPRHVKKCLRAYADTIAKTACASD